MSFKPKLQQNSIEQLMRAKADALATTTKAVTQSIYADPSTVKDRIRIIFDDSGSMRGEKLADAKAGTIEFMKSCTLNEVAVAIHPLNTDMTPLKTNLPALATGIQQIVADACTPLYETLLKAQNQSPAATRYIVFSDGSPDTHAKEQDCILRANTDRTPVDTVYIMAAHEDENSAGYISMKRLAEQTGGIFLVFQRGKVNFRTAFKYLSPGLRLMLADSSFKAKVEAGTV